MTDISGVGFCFPLGLSWVQNRIALASASKCIALCQGSAWVPLVLSLGRKKKRVIIRFDPTFLEGATPQFLVSLYHKFFHAA